MIPVDDADPLVCYIDSGVISRKHSLSMSEGGGQDTVSSRSSKHLSQHEFQS